LLSDCDDAGAKVTVRIDADKGGSRKWCKDRLTLSLEVECGALEASRVTAE
jgi:hypothetical protein